MRADRSRIGGWRQDQKGPLENLWLIFDPWTELRVRWEEGRRGWGERDRERETERQQAHVHMHVCARKCASCAYVSMCMHVCGCSRKVGRWWGRKHENTEEGPLSQDRCGNTLKRHILWGLLGSNESKPLRSRAWNCTF